MAGGDRGRCWAALALCLCVASGDAGAQDIGAETTDTVPILDRVRSAWGTQGESIGRYRARVTERWSAYVPLPLADRLAFRREVEAELDWIRGREGSVNLLGARAFIPSLGSGPHVLDNYRAEALDTAFDPTEDRRTLGIGSFRLAAHPVLRGNASNYRFTRGDTTTLRLADGQEIRLIEVTVEPVTAAAQVVGSIWVEPDSWQIVREIYRRRPEPVSADGATIPFLGEFTFELTKIGIEYGKWEGRWWMPRAVTLGRGATCPFRDSS